MEGYGIYQTGAPPNLRRSDYDTTADFFTPDSARGAALSVAVMIVASALFLTILKRSGFRAMVAVGRS